MLNDHDLATLLAGTGVSKQAPTTTDNAAIWCALLLLHGLLLAAVIALFLLAIFQ